MILCSDLGMLKAGHRVPCQKSILDCGIEDRAQRLYYKPHGARRKGLRTLRHPRLYLRCADGREPPTAESGSGNVIVDHGFDPSRGRRAMRTGCRPLLRVLGNGYWILVVDVTPVKLAVLDFFDLVFGVGTATEDLGAFPAVRVDPACLITAFAKFTDMSHLNHDPSCLGLTQISRVPGPRNQARCC